MKVGLLTIHNTTNFGSTLQAYATWKAIEEFGVECEIIDYTCSTILKKEEPKHLGDISSLKELARFLLFEHYKREKSIEQRRFLDDNTKLTNRYSQSELKDICSHYSKLIVGSDVVWGENNFKDDFSYFLDFADGSTPKFSFASSVGDRWTKEEDKIVGLLNNFEYISVREKSTASWLSDLLGRKIDYVCDPTMLFSKEEWLKVFDSKKRIISEPYILSYFSDKEGRSIRSAIEYGKKHHIKVYHINYERKIRGTKSIKPLKIDEFLNLIYFSEVVFSASYHGLLFSLYFNKPVFYFNRGFSERMNSLAEMLEFQYREGTEENLEKDREIDYEVVSDRIEQFRIASRRILKERVISSREREQ